MAVPLRPYTAPPPSSLMAVETLKKKGSFSLIAGPLPPPRLMARTLKIFFLRLS